MSVVWKSEKQCFFLISYHSRRIRRQPTSVWRFHNQWTTGICGCCGDIATCKSHFFHSFLSNTSLDVGCFAFWCFPCFMCRLHALANECPCMSCFPGSNYFIRVVFLLLLLLSLSLLGDTALRTKLRTGFRIRVSVKIN